MNVEYEAFKLAKYYIEEKRKKTFKVPKLATIKNSKWWPIFLKVVEKYGNRKEWNSYKFILSQFLHDGEILPHNLLSDRAWKIFLEYKERFNIRTKTKDIVIGIVKTLNEIKSFCNSRNHLKANDFILFFRDERNRELIRRGNFNNYIFTICKDFPKELMNEDEHMKKRAVLFSKPKLLNRLKEILGDEFE